MTTFTKLELAALHSIFAETPELAPQLDRQLAVATVTERENSGGGFFTTMTVSEEACVADSPRVLGYETQAHVVGLEHGLGFVLFMKNGRMHMLEGFAWGPESTASLDLHRLQFEIYNQPMQKLS